MRNIAWKLKVLYWHMVGAYDTWKTEVWARDPEERYCCDGGNDRGECGCEGLSVRAVWDFISEEAQQ